MKTRLIAFFLLITICLSSSGVSAASLENPDIQKRYIVKLNFAAPLLMAAGEPETKEVNVVDYSQLNRLLDAGMVMWYEEDYEVELFDAEGSVGDDIDDGENQPGDDIDDGENQPGDDIDDEDIQPDSENDDIDDDKKYGTDRWDLEIIKPDMAYMLNCTGQGVRIGIIDSGIASHSELDGRILPGKNYIDGSDDTNDEFGHGTFIAGIIASSDNGEGMIGVAPQSVIVPLKCFDGNTANVSKICDAIYGAVDDFNCDIINMSFGLKEESTALREALDYAISKNVIVVAATGNSGGTGLYYPAAYDDVIGVGSVDSSQNVSPTSQHNKSVWLTAPGSSITSLSTNGGYRVSGGTSFAAAYVTGAISALMNIKENLTTSYIKEVFALCSSDKGDEGYDFYYGHGILNMEKCIQKILENTHVFISPPTKGETDYSALLYNNTANGFSGSFICGEYSDGIMKSFSQLPVNICSYDVATVNLPTSDNSLNMFVWESTEENSVISNSRSIAGKDTIENKETYVKIILQADDDGTSDEYSFTLYNKDGVATYVSQRSLAEGGDFILYMPASDIIDSDTETDVTCEIKINAVINGAPCAIPASAHNYAVASVTEPTASENGYTTYVCSVCGDEYIGNEKDALGYFVSYSCADAENIPETQNKRHGDELIITTTVPNKEGFSFCGWTSATDLDEVQYTPGSKYTQDADITLYPVWRPKEYKLIYMIDGEEYKTEIISYGMSITATSAPEKSGYTFSYWQGLPSVMPARDVTVNGIYQKKNKGGGSGGGSGGGGKITEKVSEPEPETDSSTNEKEQSDDKEEQYNVYLFEYNDINESDWFFENVKFMSEAGLMFGTSENEFSPEAKLTRAMFVVILHRLEGMPGETEENIFADVDSGDYFLDAVNWAADNKIVNGTSENEFSPEAEITREQMAVMLFRYAVYKGYKIENIDNLQYSDSSYISDFAKSAMKWATGENLINGSDGFLYPQRTASRAEAATVFTRFIKNDK